MSPLPASRPRPRDAAKPIDDFEWPPTGDDLSVYEMGPDPLQARPHASRPVPASPPAPASRPVSAPRQRERPQPQQQHTRAAEPAPETMQKLAAVLAASAIVAAVAGCVLYGSMGRPVPVRAIHHPAPPVAPAPPPPRITIVATYPVEPVPSNEAATEAPADEQTAPGPTETAPASSEPAAVDPRTDGH